MIYSARCTSKLLCLVLDFKKTNKACKNKFNNLYAKYQITRIGNDLSGSNQEMFPYYNEFDQWYYDSGTVVKHASTSANVIESTSINELEGDDSLVRTIIVPIPKSAASGKTKFHNQALELFSKMVDNSTSMLQSFQNANAFFELVDNHMETHINKFEMLTLQFRRPLACKGFNI